VLDNIVTFATARGWTTLESKIGQKCAVGATLVWSADANRGYICLQKQGYTNQSLLVKLETIQAGMINVMMCSSSSYDQANICPSMQYGLAQGHSQSYETFTFTGMSIKETANQKMWLFGNDKWLCCVVTTDGTYTTFLHFGSYEMFEADPTEGQLCGWQGIYGVTSPVIYNQWEDYTATDAVKCAFLRNIVYSYTWGGGYFGGPSFMFRYESEDKCYNNELNYSIWGFGKFKYTTAPAEFLANFDECLTVNGFSGRRTMMKQILSYKRNADSVWVPVARSPFYVCNFLGCTIGETLTYGSEQYMVFPICTVSDTAGIAFRIA